MSRQLPARPHLDHLKNEAKALHNAVVEGDLTALDRVRAALGDKPVRKLTDAQRVIAREYGFPTWARLRAHVQSARDPAVAIDAFLAAIDAQDVARATDVLRAQPSIAAQSLHVAATLGRVDDVRRLIGENPSAVTAKAGSPAADSLLFLCFSPFHGESADRDAGLLESARLLLRAGANPNTVDGRYGVSALYGVTGMHDVLPLARLLLDAGANPTDGESVFHAAERFHEEALDLLLAAGADLNQTGTWGNTPLYFLLRWHDLDREAPVRQGVLWLLHHDADPNVLCAKEQENSLHVAARRGHSAATVRLLLDHGADVRARRGDGSTAWLLARRGGFDEVAATLESAGAQTESLSPLDTLFAACGRGDVEAARRLTSPALIGALAPADRLLVPEAAALGRDAAVAAYLAAGFPIDTVDANGATALHLAALQGRAGLIRTLLASGADFTIVDPEHSATPLGWATWGSEYVADRDGDYEGSVRALLEAGARLLSNELTPKHAGVRGVLGEYEPAS